MVNFFIGPLCAKRLFDEKTPLKCTTFNSSSNEHRVVKFWNQETSHYPE